MEKLIKFDDQVSHLFLSIREKVNEIVDYINQNENKFAASGSDTSRTTPNNGENPYRELIDEFTDNHMFVNPQEKHNHKVFLKVFCEFCQDKKKDNPVPSLDNKDIENLIKSIIITFGNKSIGNELILKLSKLQNGVTTDKENLIEFEMHATEQSEQRGITKWRWKV